jgi:hypothetical protein
LLCLWLTVQVWFAAGAVLANVEIAGGNDGNDHGGFDPNDPFSSMRASSEAVRLPYTHKERVRVEGVSVCMSVLCVCVCVCDSLQSE